MLPDHPPGRARRRPARPLLVEPSCSAISYANAHADPWLALQRADENLAIYDVIGGERTFLVAHLFRDTHPALLGAA